MRSTVAASAAREIRSSTASARGLYGAYVLPFFQLDGDVVGVAFLVSTWKPYNLVLFEARFRVGAAPE